MSHYVTGLSLNVGKTTKETSEVRNNQIGIKYQNATQLPWFSLIDRCLWKETLQKF